MEKDLFGICPYIERICSKGKNASCKSRITEIQGQYAVCNF